MSRCASSLLHLLVLDHDFQPLLEVFLHAHTASLHEVLNAFDFSLEFLQFRVLSLVLRLVLVDATLNLIFLLSAD